MSCCSLKVQLHDRLTFFLYSSLLSLVVNISPSFLTLFADNKIKKKLFRPT